MSGQNETDIEAEDAEKGQGPDQIRGEALDDHRPFVRELDRKFSTVYGVGGAAVLGSGLAVIGFAWWRNLLGEPNIWALAVTVVLVSLFVLRLFVRRRAERYLSSIREYCRANDVDPQQLREHFDEGERYPYFQSVFETVERREKLRSERDSESR